MNSYTYALFIAFTIILMMIIVDQNVEDYIILIFKIFKINFQKTIWSIRFHPFWVRNPIGKWWTMRKYMRTVEQLAQEISKKDSDAV